MNPNIAELMELFGVSEVAGLPNDVQDFITPYTRSAYQMERTYWECYTGKYFMVPDREDGILPHVNICKGVTDKAGTWLFSKPFQPYTVPDNQTIVNEFYQEILENSDADVFLQLHQIGSVTGNALLQIVYDPDTNFGAGGVCFRTIDSDKYYVQYSYIRNKPVLTKVMVVWKDVGKLSSRNGKIIEVWDADTVTIYPASVGMTFNGSTKLERVNEVAGNNIARAGGVVYKNPYGFLPFEHINNQKVSNNIFGLSDYHNIYAINKEMCSSLVNYKDNVDYHNFPITLVYGMSVDSIEKSPGKIWGNLNPAGRIENLEVTQTYQQIQEYMKLLEKYEGICGIPLRLFSLDQADVSDTSYAALKLFYLPLVELIDRKKLTYGEGIKNAFQKALQILDYEKELGLSALNTVPKMLVKRLQTALEERDLPDSMLEKLLELRTVPFYYTWIQFAEYLPRNKALELADLDVMLRNKLESIQGALIQLGVEDPESKIEEIKQNIADGLIASANPSFGTGGAEMGGGDTPATSEEDTGQSADRTQAQRSYKGQGSL